MTPDPHPWAATLPSLLDQVRARLARGVHDRHAHARNLTLATVSPNGAP
jgi:pyridoxamine 5'-phosphate oxidase